MSVLRWYCKNVDRILPWYLALAACIGISSLVIDYLLPVGNAMTLQISGSSTGQGIQNLSFAGDFLNVSILQNSSFQGWNVTLGASA